MRLFPFKAAERGTRGVEFGEIKKGRPDLAPLLAVTIYNFKLPAITSTAATATTTTPFAASVTETAGPSLLWPGFVHGEIAAVEIRAIQSLNRFLGLVGIRHFDKSEAARSPRELISNDSGRFNSPMRRKDFLELRISGRIRQATYINFTAHVLSF
jgi:hypothetical protein